MSTSTLLKRLAALFESSSSGPSPAGPSPKAPPPSPPPAPPREVPRYDPPRYDPPPARAALTPYVRYAQHLALRLREHWAAEAGSVPPGEREAFVGGLRELLEKRIEPGDAPATVHRRVQWLKSFGLPEADVAEVLGEGEAVDAYFRMRRERQHVFGADERCTVCEAVRRTAPARCGS